MFEPGDKVKISNTEVHWESGDLEKVWTVLSYPWKCWRDQMVRVADEDGREKAINVNDLSKVEEPAGEPGFSCSRDFYEIVRKEMRLE